MTQTTQAQIEAAAKEIRVMQATVGNPTPENLAYAALTAAAQVGEPITTAEMYDNRVNAVLRTRQKEIEAATIERCAQYHDNAARECDAIAAANMDNDLGPDCVTRAIDHRIDAAAIRELKDEHAAP